MQQDTEGMRQCRPVLASVHAVLQNLKRTRSCLDIARRPELHYVSRDGDRRQTADDLLKKGCGLR